jgi:Leu/Phe-tRNA-protein transferase
MYPYVSLADLQNNELLNHIYHNFNDSYYITDDLSPEMYDALAYNGFISVSVKDQYNNDYLLPEMQTSYAVLHWENLHISKRLKQFIKKHILPKNDYFISINEDIQAVFDGIRRYHREKNWMNNSYTNILNKMFRQTKFRQIIISVELWHHHHLIGGEIGYLTGKIYTSLTGFFDINNYSNFGKIQLISLAALLKNADVAFWNMGHPYMKYKFDIGAREYARLDFLNMWLKYRNKKICKMSSGKKGIRPILSHLAGV